MAHIVLLGGEHLCHPIGHITLIKHFQALGVKPDYFRLGEGQPNQFNNVFEIGEGPRHAGRAKMLSLACTLMKKRA